MSKALMIQGTGSGAGKSLITTALCRIFSDQGIDVAPFKSQNMALNSYITAEGGEIGRAQALQARAARLDPANDMNPILLKVSGESGSQVIIHGKAFRTMKAREYYAFRNKAWKSVEESYQRLSRRHELIIIEGAGSPAEINLMDVDIVNTAMARHAGAPVLLVGDIDKGGVFASLFGTVKLLGRDSRYVKGFVINKFRGDRAILDPGLEQIRGRTGKPVIGVLPYIHDLGLPEEDGLALSQKTEGRRLKADGKKVSVVVVRLKYISNFTDFDPLAAEPGVALLYSDDPSDVRNADLVIIPGSKNTVEDLLLLKRKGLVDAVRKAHEQGTQIIGICGGYQMLGRKIRDPYGAESGHTSVDGIGLLNIETVFRKEKKTCLVEAEVLHTGGGRRKAGGNGKDLLQGYEIHMGESTGDVGLFSVKRVAAHSAVRNPQSETILDGSLNGNCWGTYIHGIFENDSFRQGIMNPLRKKRGLPAVSNGACYAASQEKAIDRLADVFREHVDLRFIQRLVKL